MRRIAFLFMLLPSVLFAQQDCELFNLQELAEAYLTTQVDSIVLHLSNGNTQTLNFSNGLSIKFGCTDPASVVFDPAAIVDDGSCTTPVVNGCTDPAYIEYDTAANTDDGSCATLVIEGCTDAAFTEYDPSANTDDGSCATLASTCTEVEMDGYTYSVVEIGDQCWFAENLRTTTYADGTGISEVTDGVAWGELIVGARCDYNNDASNVATYGRLYNWYAVVNARGLCPSGWHVPTDGEWTQLEDYITSQGFDGTEGTALKSTSGFLPFRAASAPTTMAPSSVLATPATGGVRLPMAPWLGTGSWAFFQPSAGAATIHVTGSRSGVLGMPSERSEGGLML